MKTLFKFTLILSLLFIGQSCDKDKDCEDVILNTTSLESEYGCTNTQFQIQISLYEEFIVIRNQEDFELLAEGDCQPEIDFATYDLVIGKKGLNSGYDSIEYVLTEKCDSGDLELEVTFIQDATMIAPVVVFHALVPKLGTDQEISVNIVTNN